MSQRSHIDKFPHHKILLLGIVISILGLGCILVAIIGFTLRVWGHYVGTGLWCGTMIFAAGVSGIISSQFRGSKSVKCYFVCSALATIMSLVMIVMSSAGLDYNSNFYNNVAYFKTINIRSTFYCYVTSLTLSLLSLMGNIASLFFCAQHNSFYRQKYKRNKTIFSTGRKSTSRHGNYLRASINSRSALQDQEMIPTNTQGSLSEQSNDQTTGTEIKISGKEDVNHRWVKRSNSDRHRKNDRRHSQDQIYNSKPQNSKMKNERDEQKFASKIPHHGYRSLPHRSQHHHKSRSSYDVEVGKELLPTAFDEDDLPSYTDAINHPPLLNPKVNNGNNLKREDTKENTAGKRIPKHLNDGCQITYKGNSEQERKRIIGEEHQTLSIDLNNALHQNLQNEEVEMYKSGRKVRSPTRLSLKHYINLTEHKEMHSFNHESNLPHEYLQTTNIENNFDIVPVSSDQGKEHSVNICERSINEETTNINHPAFTSLNSDVHSFSSFPITIGSPRSAFRPVKRKSSQKLINNVEVQPVQQCSGSEMPSFESVLYFKPGGSVSSENGNVWKNIVLPSTLKNNTESDQYQDESASNIVCESNTGANTPDRLRNVSNYQIPSGQSSFVVAGNNSNSSMDNYAATGIQPDSSSQLPVSRGVHRSAYNTLPFRGSRNCNQPCPDPLHQPSANQSPQIIHPNPSGLQVNQQRIQNAQNLDQARDCDTPYYSQIL